MTSGMDQYSASYVMKRVMQAPNCVDCGESVLNVRQGKFDTWVEDIAPSEFDTALEDNPAVDTEPRIFVKHTGCGWGEKLK